MDSFNVLDVNYFLICWWYCCFLW